MGTWLPGFLLGSQPPPGPDWLLSCTHNTCGPETSPEASRALTQFLFPFLAIATLLGWLWGQVGLSVCALRTAFVYILPLKLSGAQLLLGRLGLGRAAGRTERQNVWKTLAWYLPGSRLE